MLFNKLPKPLLTDVSPFPEDMFTVYENPCIIFDKHTFSTVDEKILETVRWIHKNNNEQVQELVYCVLKIEGLIRVSADMIFDSEGESLYDMTNDGRFTYCNSLFHVDESSPNLASLAKYIILPFRIESYGEDLNLDFISNTVDDCMSPIYVMHKNDLGDYEFLGAKLN